MRKTSQTSQNILKNHDKTFSELQYHEKTYNGFTVIQGNRQYQIIGLQRRSNNMILSIRLRDIDTGKEVLDSFNNIYSNRQRQRFAGIVYDELSIATDVTLADLRLIIAACESYKYKSDNKQEEATTQEEIEAVMEWASSPDLLSKVIDDFHTMGVVSENLNICLVFLATCSRLLDSPISLLLLSSTSAGKSFLVDKAMKLLKKSDVLDLTAVSSKALFYRQEPLDRMVIRIEEISGINQEEGLYPIRSLLSQKRLSILTTIIDPRTGELKTMEKVQEASVSMIATTTKPNILDEETKSRFVVNHLLETKEHTVAIQQAQRDKYSLESLQKAEKINAIIKRHHAFQELLKTEGCKVIINPFADELTFDGSRVEFRRQNEIYLQIIQTIAFVRQFSRPVRKSGETSYVEIILDDIKIANRIYAEVGKSIKLELSDNAIQLLSIAHDMMSKNQEELDESKRFTRRQLKEHSGWSNYKIYLYSNELSRGQYFIRSGKKEHGEIAYTLADCNNFSDKLEESLGLISVDKLKKLAQNASK